MMSGWGVTSCFFKNISKIILSFVVDVPKLSFFVGQILKSIIAFILERKEYVLHATFFMPVKTEAARGSARD